MPRRLLVLLLVTSLARPAVAEPSSILVLQAEGGGDARTRAQVDAAVLELARTGTAQVSPGDITFADAAAAVGCKPQAPGCTDEVIEMLGVDEVVYATLTPRPGGLELLVHRVPKGGGGREARTLIVTGQAPGRLDELAPLFGGTPAAATRPAEPPPSEPPPSEPPPAPPPTALELAPSGDPAPVVITTQPAAHAGPTDLTRPRIARLPVIGMVGGGTMVILGFMLWGQASDLRGQIDAAPTRTLPELQALAELEARGDRYAGWGNLMFLGGAVLGGISTYYFLKERKHARATTARIAPTVFDRGAGLTLTIGGMP